MADKTRSEHEHCWHNWLNLMEWCCGCPLQQDIERAVDAPALTTVRFTAKDG